MSLRPATLGVVLQTGPHLRLEIPVGGLELPHSVADLSALVVKEVGHDSSSSLVSCDRTHTYESSPYTNFLGRTFLEVFAQSLECASGLALWHSAHKRAADDSPQRSQRGVELVAIVKACTLPLGLQGIFGVRS